MSSTVIWNPLGMFGIGQVGLPVSLFEHLQQGGVTPYLLDTQYRWASNFKSVSGLFSKFDIDKWRSFQLVLEPTHWNFPCSHQTQNLQSPWRWYIVGIVLLQQFLLVYGFMGNGRQFLCTVARLILIGSCFAWVFLCIVVHLDTSIRSFSLFHLEFPGVTY